MIKEYLKPYSFMLSIACLCIILAISAVMLNRAFFVGALSGVIFLVFVFKKIALSKKTVGLSFLFVVIAISIATIFLKSDSSLGRIFIYKISWSMFLDQPITGIGWGNFQRDYGLYQAAYFSAGNFTQKEFLLADNTFYAFNDYWEFIVETGVIGAVCLFTSLYFLVSLVYRRLNTNLKDDILKLLLALFLVIGIAALFTHVVEHRPFKIVLAFILAYLALPSVFNVKTKNLQNATIVTITATFALFQYYFELKNIGNYRKLEHAKTLSATGYILESQKIYTELYPQLKGDIEFLKNYNAVLVGHHNASKKIFLLKEILKHYTSHISFLEMATIYEELDMNKEAEIALLQSVYMVPNRFVPKEALYRFYSKNKQYEQAKFWRKIILTMPVKIPSERVEAIKQTVKNLNNDEKQKPLHCHSGLVYAHYLSLFLPKGLFVWRRC
ncbi:hypothetical protein GM921_11895 [Pedobacter sp. LMG 31464]|uniref:O-antigen ligase-related domain-containing protein n=1 Tax=Pedobacter planticolens TaxID=2679964 RepID=A0A923DY38_9SPHI|nr:O-antigen ligase family protein [Pedobacter planticolens]MBB2146192.1 hypothetical protein [Pedobacter planticolens]